MENVYREVHFEKYCKICKHEDKRDYEEPCDECLQNPVNRHSRKPVKFEEK